MKIKDKLYKCLNDLFTDSLQSQFSDKFNLVRYMTLIAWLVKKELINDN